MSSTRFKDSDTGDIIFLDTAPFIYYFERHPDDFPALEMFFNQLYATDAQAITAISERFPQGWI